MSVTDPVGAPETFGICTPIPAVAVVAGAAAPMVVFPVSKARNSVLLLATSSQSEKSERYQSLPRSAPLIRERIKLALPVEDFRSRYESPPVAASGAAPLTDKEPELIDAA